jgi:ABC-type sugar transport system permease subunit
MYDSTFSIHTLTRARRFVGADNYLWLAQDPGVRAALGRSLVWTAGTVLGQVLVALGLALLLNRQIAGRGLYRTLVLFPYIVPTVVAALIFRFMLEPTVGIVNYLLQAGGLIAAPQAWLATPSTAMTAVILIGIWKHMPFMVVLLLGRLQAVPTELYEAARIDGSNAWQELRHITLPWLLPVLTVAMLLRTIWAFNEFDIIYLLTSGGPLTATTTMPLIIRQIAFSTLDMGKASAVALAMCVMLLGAVGLYFCIYQRSIDQHG